MSFYSPPPNINVASGKTLFLPKDFIKNSNIDVGGGKSVPKFLYKVDMCACDGKYENKIHFAKLFCPGLNHGQNMWQKMSFYSPPPNINVASGKTLFLPKDFIKNINIDVGGGKSVPKILYKVDMCACDGKYENKIHFAKIFCPGL